MFHPSIAVTAGEPAGIGFDIILKSIPELNQCTVIADASALKERAKLLNIPLQVTDSPPLHNDQLHVVHIPVNSSVRCGRLEPKNADYVLKCLNHGLQGTLDGFYSALVTGPIHKGVINDAGIDFTGHTEYLANKTKSDVVMLLVAKNVRVALATTHLPLAEVPNSITRQLLEDKISILHAELIRKFGIQDPRIAVCGLNPHAGEQGHLGMEEIKIIAPAINTMCQRKMNITGPHPADTIFTPQFLTHADAILAMYHDQGLPVLKHLGFGHAVNTTLGLPVIRTSVDHGTAVELAGTGNCDTGSLLAAVDLAKQQINRSIKTE